MVPLANSVQRDIKTTGGSADINSAKQPGTATSACFAKVDLAAVHEAALRQRRMFHRMRSYHWTRWDSRSLPAQQLAACASQGPEAAEKAGVHHGCMTCVDPCSWQDSSPIRSHFPQGSEARKAFERPPCSHYTDGASLHHSHAIHQKSYNLLPSPVRPSPQFHTAPNESWSKLLFPKWRKSIDGPAL